MNYFASVAAATVNPLTACKYDSTPCAGSATARMMIMIGVLMWWDAGLKIRAKSDILGR